MATFRFVPDEGDPNEFNRRLIKAVQADGKVFISSTLIDDKFVLRLAVLHFRAHLDKVDYLLGLLRRLVVEIGLTLHQCQLERLRAARL